MIDTTPDRQFAELARLLDRSVVARLMRRIVDVVERQWRRSHVVERFARSAQAMVALPGADRWRLGAVFTAVFALAQAALAFVVPVAAAAAIPFWLWLAVAAVTVAVYSGAEIVDVAWRHRGRRQKSAL